MVFRFGGLPRLSCRMRLFGYLGTLIFQRRVQCRVRCFARRFLGCDSLGSGRWHQNAGLYPSCVPRSGVDNLWPAGIAWCHPSPSTGVSPSDNVSGSGWAITYGYSRSYRRNSSLGAAVDGASMGSAIAELFVSVAGEATAAGGSTSGAMAWGEFCAGESRWRTSSWSGRWGAISVGARRAASLAGEDWGASLRLVGFGWSSRSKTSIRLVKSRILITHIKTPMTHSKTRARFMVPCLPVTALLSSRKRLWPETRSRGLSWPWSICGRGLYNWDPVGLIVCFSAQSQRELGAGWWRSFLSSAITYVRFGSLADMSGCVKKRPLYP